MCCRTDATIAKLVGKVSDKIFSNADNQCYIKLAHYTGHQIYCATFELSSKNNVVRYRKVSISIHRKAEFWK